MIRPSDLTAVEARQVIGSRQLSPVELPESCIEQMRRLIPP